MPLSVGDWLCWSAGCLSFFFKQKFQIAMYVLYTQKKVLPFLINHFFSDAEMFYQVSPAVVIILNNLYKMQAFFPVFEFDLKQYPVFTA